MNIFIMINNEFWSEFQVSQEYLKIVRSIIFFDAKTQKIRYEIYDKYRSWKFKKIIKILFKMKNEIWKIRILKKSKSDLDH